MSPDSPHDETQSLHDTSRFMERARKYLAPQLLTAHPEVIGPYRVRKVLGERGMGVVFIAEQETLIHRRAALKVIQLGMDTRQVIARFEAEREALALMNHANIAKVFE